MKRIIWMVLMNIVHIPWIIYNLLRMSSHPEKYTIEERYAVLHRTAQFAVRGGRVSIESDGMENLPKDGGYILYPNHQGLFDIVVMLWLNQEPVTFVLKKELANIPFIKQCIVLLEAVSLDRDDARQGLKVIQQVAEEVKKGRRFIIFAEGRRSREGNKVQEFKGGSFKSATKSKCPIVPVAIDDSYKVMDTGSLERITVHVSFLNPVYYDEYKDMKTLQIAEMVRSRIVANIEECETAKSNN